MNFTRIALGLALKKLDERIRFACV